MGIKTRYVVFKVEMDVNPCEDLELLEQHEDFMDADDVAEYIVNEMDVTFTFDGDEGRIVNTECLGSMDAPPVGL